jgi:hypothetical protein
MTHAVLDYAAVSSLLLLGLVALHFRRQIFRPAERIKIRAAAWSLFDERAASGDKSAEEERPRPRRNRSISNERALDFRRRHGG